MVLPDKLFVRALITEIAVEPLLESQDVLLPTDMTKNQPIYQQDEDILHPWVDTHRLKKIEGLWYKDGRQVVTGGQHDKCMIICAHHDTPVYGHPSINRTMQLVMTLLVAKCWLKCARICPRVRQLPMPQD